MTLQEIFDRVATHLLTQGKQSRGPTGCAYRGADGLKCAVGVLITEGCYSPHLESSTVLMPHVRQAVEASIGPLPPKGDVLLSELQSLHDGYNPSDWPRALTGFAARYGLTMPEAPCTGT